MSVVYNQDQMVTDHSTVCYLKKEKKAYYDHFQLYIFTLGLY